MELSAQESRRLLDALRRMRLVRSDEAPSLTQLTGGVSSLIVRADTARGPLCVKQALPQLKVAAFWEAPVERNRAEVAWLRIAQGIVPGSVPAILGEDAQDNAFAMEWLDPAEYPTWKAQLRDGVADTAESSPEITTQIEHPEVQPRRRLDEHGVVRSRHGDHRAADAGVGAERT